MNEACKRVQREKHLNTHINVHILFIFKNVWKQRDKHNFSTYKNVCILIFILRGGTKNMHKSRINTNN